MTVKLNKLDILQDRMSILQGKIDAGIGNKVQLSKELLALREEYTKIIKFAHRQDFRRRAYTIE